jgi:hypothetical protein
MTTQQKTVHTGAMLKQIGKALIKHGQEVEFLGMMHDSITAKNVDLYTRDIKAIIDKLGVNVRVRKHERDFQGRKVYHIYMSASTAKPRKAKQ